MSRVAWVRVLPCGLAVLAIVLGAGCHAASDQAPGAVGSATAPALSCTRVAEHLAATVTVDSDKPGFNLPELAPVLLRVVPSRCDQDHWSEDAKTCFLALSPADGESQCDAKLTGEQLAKLRTELGTAPEPARANSAGSGVQDPPVPPVIDAVAPWIERAQRVLPALFDGKNGTLVATAILTITHSTGNNPRLKTYEIRRMGARISLRIAVNWDAPMLRDASGNPAVYTTEVIWEFSEQGHGSAKVTSDNATWGAGGEQQLDDWFRNELYPSLYQAAGG